MILIPKRIFFAQIIDISLYYIELNKQNKKTQPFHGLQIFQPVVVVVKTQL